MEVDHRARGRGIGPPVGILPGGTGNVLGARRSAIPLRVDRAVRALLAR